jgi:DUF2971 family protein
VALDLSSRSWFLQLKPSTRPTGLMRRKYEQDVPQRLKLLDTKFKSYLVEIDKINQPNPCEFVHYTGGAAAQSILSTKIIRASDIFSMNDSTEISYGIRIVGMRLQSRPSVPAEIRRLFRPPEQGQLNRFMDTAKDWRAYITCFSADRNMASQWKQYADEGRGVAIVFNRQSLCAHAQDIGECSAFPMVYDETEQGKIVNVVACMCELHAQGLGGVEQLTAYWNTAFSDLAISSFRFKGKDWVAEDEWRLFWLAPHAMPKKRETTDTRYVELSFTPSTISEVVIGPQADTRLEQQIRDILCSVEYSHVKVTRLSCNEKSSGVIEPASTSRPGRF